MRFGSGIHKPLAVIADARGDAAFSFPRATPGLFGARGRADHVRA
jgi:hypothetical protein